MIQGAQQSKNNCLKIIGGEQIYHLGPAEYYVYSIFIVLVLVVLCF